MVAPLAFPSILIVNQNAKIIDDYNGDVPDLLKKRYLFKERYSPYSL